ncbi:hypothetical protein GC194_01800 [bacterium]|nr:hypothetical protein [bacterium]
MNPMNENIPHNLKDAFANFEAPFSAEEMQGDWSAVSQGISAAPQSGASGTASSGGSVLTAGVKVAFIAAAVAGLSVLGIKYFGQTNEEASQPVAIVETQPEQVLEEVQNTDKPEAAQLTDETKQLAKTEITERKPKINSIQAKNTTIDNNTIAVVHTDTNQTPRNQHERAVVNTVVKASASIASNKLCAGESVELSIENPAEDKLYFYRLQCEKKNILLTGTVEQSRKVAIAVDGTYTLTITEMGERKHRELLNESLTVAAKPLCAFEYSTDDCGNYHFAPKVPQKCDYLWIFSTVTKTGAQVSHGFEKSGMEKVQLIATSNGCADTATREILVNPAVGAISNPSIVNIITPNNDGRNDVFDVLKENPQLANVEDGSIEIYNSDNQLVFKTINGFSESWNGKDVYLGHDCAPGIYTYVISYRSPCQTGGYKILKGLITLKR